ncbi:SAM-dependent methyltransferase [Algibacter mikhailovii]|uniref:S-adenosylmethionine-dependent methyltransferase n=1 Tax=Algibacter mikhailovii TaxID=425498 RepID=A0A918QQ20_9FLAO|nr:SAM-dependent methyltransferase [Algibacter mikhailovii]GGZ67402.1 S-adenosylmethionine-dependent methyltransferase [Algibacter mikhailovii]
MDAKGNLYLIPTTLGDNAPLEVLPISVKRVIEETDFFIVENEKTARRFIKKICPEKSQPSLNLFLLNKFTKDTDVPTFLAPCLNGINVGILSEAGCPGVADPGADVVRIAHSKNIKVIPLVGPSSILMAIMSSGMNGQSFAFNGYLPIDKGERKNHLKRLERLSFELNQSQIFIETPYRNNKMLEDLSGTLDRNTHVCVACDITLSTEFIKTKTAETWKKNKVDLHKRPTIFIIHKFKTI